MKGVNYEVLLQAGASNLQFLTLY